MDETDDEWETNTLVKKVGRNPNHDVQSRQVRICCRFPFVVIIYPYPSPFLYPYQKRETIPHLWRNGLGGCARHDQHHLYARRR
jgi:hypothetical protein